MRRAATDRCVPPLDPFPRVCYCLWPPATARQGVQWPNSAGRPTHGPPKRKRLIVLDVRSHPVARQWLPPGPAPRQLSRHHRRNRRRSRSRNPPITKRLRSTRPASARCKSMISPQPPISFAPSFNATRTNASCSNGPGSTFGSASVKPRIGPLHRKRLTSGFTRPR